MNYYLIWFFEDKIYIDEYLNSKKNSLKNMGEKYQTFKHEVFWNWWRKKVEYQGEEVVFIVITDQNKFDVPDDIKIKSIKNKISLDKHLYDLIPLNSNIISKPNNIISNLKHHQPTENKIKKVPSNNHSLEDYFIKKTTHFRS